MSRRPGLFEKIWTGIKFRWDNRMSQRKPIYMGEDVYGNKFFESEVKSFHGKNTRLCIPPSESKLLNKVSPEWEAWLRHRRDSCPTPEEIFRNLQNAKIRKDKASERIKGMIENSPEYAPRVREIRSKQAKRESTNPYNPSFPRYKDMSSNPFDDENSKK